MLTLVHSNISLLVQEWNEIQEIIATELIDQNYSFILNHISPPKGPLNSWKTPKEVHHHEQSSSIMPDPALSITKENDAPSPSRSPQTGGAAMSNPLLVAGVQREQTSSVSFVATGLHIVEEAKKGSLDSSQSNYTTQHLFTEADQVIPGSQIRQAAESSSKISSQNHSTFTAASPSCEASKPELVSSNRSPYCHTSLPIAGCVPDFSCSDDAFLVHACSNIEVMHYQSSRDDSDPSKWLKIRALDLDQLTAEAMMLKENLPKVVNSYYISCIRRVPQLEREVAQARREREQWAGQCKDLSWRCDALMADLEEGRKELFATKVWASPLLSLYGTRVKGVTNIPASAQDHEHVRYDETSEKRTVLGAIKPFCPLLRGCPL